MASISLSLPRLAGQTGLTLEVRNSERRELLEDGIALTETSTGVFEGTSVHDLGGYTYIMIVHYPSGDVAATKKYSIHPGPPSHDSGHLPAGSEDQMLRHNGTEYVSKDFSSIVHSTANDLQGYYTYVTNFYDDTTPNATQEIQEEVWTDLSPDVFYDTRKMPDLIETAHESNSGNPFLDTDYNKFSLAGCGSDTTHLVRVLLRFDPDQDESQLDFRLFCETNEYTQNNGGLTDFTIDKQGLVMTQGANRFYSDEILIGFFTGGSLGGSTRENAGNFKVQVKGSCDGTLEVQAFTITMSL